MPPDLLVRGFFVASSTNPRRSRTVQDSNRAALRSRVSNQPSGLLLSPRFPTARNVYQERCRPTHSSRVFLFWWTVQDENRDKQRQGITVVMVSCLLLILTVYGILGSVQQILLMCLSRVFYRFFDFLLEKGRIKLNPQQLWIFEKTI